MQDVYYAPDLKNNILSIRRLLEKGFSIFTEGRLLHLNDKSGRVLACVETTNNSMFKLKLKIKTLSFRCEWKVKDEEVFKTSKALEVQMVEMKVAKDKAQFMAHVMKDGIFNPPINEGESSVVVLEEDTGN